jgi:hypothetical protein
MVLSQTCLNCTGLGCSCTFEFVTARIEERKRRLARVGSGSRTPLGPIAKRRNQVLTLSTSPDGGEQRIEETQPFETDLTLAADFGFDDFGEKWDFLMPELTALTSFTPNPSSNQYTPGLWSGSPIQLLNSTITTTFWGDYLDDIYKSMMNGIESRYLAYTCNLYSPTGKYSFDDGEEEVEEYPPSSSSSNTVASLELSGLSRSPEENSRKVTFVGLARFLDHFGHLYGNKLDKQTKREDEEILIAVKSAFALQWLDCGEPSTKTSPLNNAIHDDEPRSRHPGVSNARFFATAWFNARSRILNASPHRSFTRVYTIFLFHITNLPAEAESYSQEVNGYLRSGLQDFLALKQAVEDFCEHMSPTSTYRMLLESSLKIFHWFGYVRDTMASTVFDRECILPDAPLRPGLLILSMNHP